MQEILKQQTKNNTKAIKRWITKKKWVDCNYRWAEKRVSEKDIKGQQSEEKEKKR